MRKSLFSFIFIIISLVNANSQIDPLLQSAFEKLNKRNFEGSILDFNQLLLIKPDNPDALCGRAEAKINTGNFTEALKDVEQVLNLDNKNGRAHTLKGDVLYEQKDYTSALKSYVQALELNNPPTRAIVGKAKTMNQMGYVKEAFKILDDAIAAQPTNAELYYARGILNNAKEKYSKALPDFEKAATLNPEFNPYGVALNAGIAYLNLEEPDKAIENFSKAVEADPRSSSAYHNRGLAYYSLESFKEAVDDFQKSFEINPNNPVIMFNLGMAYYKQGEKENACRYFQKSCQQGNANSCKMVLMICSSK